MPSQTMLNFKQKLGNLSLASSPLASPSTTHSYSSDAWSPRGGRRKGLFPFPPPWTKRPQSMPHEYREWERVQDAMAKLIFQAGVDFETRPMVVVNASAMPDPDDVSYDLLLSRILSYLDLYVESDYTVIFFAASGGHPPPWNWIWKAYRSLSRKYRKNLKQMYIVHPSFFTKMLFNLAGAFISPKFFRKITHISTLSELAYYVPLTQIDIPPSVYQENFKYESEITLPMPTKSSIFGVPLEELMGYHGEKGGIPRVVKDSIQFLRDSGLEHEGLFRRSPSSAMLRAAQEAYDRGNVVSLNTFGDPFLAAVLIKKYFRDLPEAIFPERLYPVIRRCPAFTSDPSDIAAITHIRETLLPELIPCAYVLLSSVLHLMHEVSLRAALNKMDAHNLSIVLCPNLVKSSNPMHDVMICNIPGGPSMLQTNAPGVLNASFSDTENKDKTTLGMVIKLCIQRYYEVFDEVLNRDEVVSPRRTIAFSGYELDGEEQTAPHDSNPFESISAPNRNSDSNADRPIRHPTHVIHDEDDDEDDEEEDINDTVLVTPPGPGGHRTNAPIQRAKGIENSTTAMAQQHRSHLSVSNTGTNSPSGIRSVNTNFGDGMSVNGTGNPQIAYFMKARSRSMINIEGPAGKMAGKGRKGSISVGRGTTGKSVGAGVEALGITAAGFFTPPSPNESQPRVDS